MENYEKMAHGWINLGNSHGNIFYHKLLLAKMVENKNPGNRIDYNKCHIAVAKNGGPVGILYIK
jgi:hypothetical protein